MNNKIKGYVNEINEFSQLCKENHLDSHSAAAAFFMFVSIIPFFIVFLLIIPFTPVDYATILNFIKSILPERIDYYAEEIVRLLSNQSVSALFLSAIVAMWSSSRALLTIKAGFNDIRGAVEKKNFFVLRLDAVFYTFLLIVSVLLLFILNVVFTGIIRYLRVVLNIDIVEDFKQVHILVILRPLITIAVAFLVNLYFYTVLPKDKIKVKSQIPGAAIVALVWYLYSTLFSIYINNFNAYSMYGSLSVVIIVLFWLYACMYILFLGGQFNYYLSLRQQNNKI